jgi:hypothetical protein
VLTLIILEELEKNDIYHVLYADDGLFYSNENKNYLEEAQLILNKHGVGAHFHRDKSKSIKEDGT